MVAAANKGSVTARLVASIADRLLITVPDSDGRTTSLPREHLRSRRYDRRQPRRWQVSVFPITPSRSFPPTTLTQGVVHLDVLAGREAVRGQVGGALPTTVVSGGARVIVPAGALQNDTVITLTPTVLSSFLPAAGGVVPLAEMTLDFGGQILANAGTVGSDAPGLTLASTDTVLLARVERIGVVPALVAVAHAALQDGRLVSLASPGLPGVTRGFTASSLPQATHDVPVRPWLSKGPTGEPMAAG